MHSLDIRISSLLLCGRVLCPSVVPFSPHWAGWRTVELHDASHFWHSPPHRTPVASSPRQHRTTSSTKESCYRQTGGKSLCSWELAATSWHLQPTTISPDIPKAFVAWVGTSWHQKLERILEVGLSGQCTSRGRPHNPTTGLCSSSTTMVSPEPFPHQTRSLRCLQEEMKTFRLRSVVLQWDPNDVTHCRILPTDTVACLNYTLQTMMPLPGGPVMAPNAYDNNS